jgi:hypothetical protein
MSMKYVAAIAFLSAGLFSAASQAQVFETIHPDVVKGGFELEMLNGVKLDDVERGDERSVHEIALAYAPTDFWKTTFAVEIANPEKQEDVIEAYEWENVFLLPFGESNAAGHGHSQGHSQHGFFALEAIGLFLGLEVPEAGGIDSGELAVGPVAEIAFGPVLTVSNLFLEIPFADGADEGVAYALQAQYPVADWAGIGFEAYGDIANAFADDVEHQHFIGPALFTNFDLGRGRILQPRVAVLFGLAEDAPDAVLSVNLELKF